MRDNTVEKLFSLLTSSDRAVSIAGDLAEEREQRGSTWFWLHVVSVTLALWRNAVTEAPLRVLALVLAGLGLLLPPAFGGVAAVFLVPQLTDSVIGWIGLPLFWWGGALWAGASLVALEPRCGMAACAILAVGGEALLIGLGGATMWRDPSNTDFVLFCATGLIAPTPLLTGAAIAHRRLVNCAVLPRGQQR